MDPEKPPRRKKTGETPVTIDLEAAPASEAQSATHQPPAFTAQPTSENPEAAKDPAAPQEGGLFTRSEEPAQTDATATPFADAETTGEPAKTDAAAEPAGWAESTPGSEETAGTPPPYEPFVREEPRPEQRPGKSGALAAAIVGGLVALAGAGALQYAGILPMPGPDGRGSADLAPLSAEVESLKSQLSALMSATPSPSAQLQPIETRLAALEQAAAGTAGSMGEEAHQSIATLEATVAKLSADVTALRDQASLAARAAADQSTRLEAAEQKLAEPRSDVAMARAVAATALKTAIDRGGPYLAELEAYVSVSPDDPSVGALRATAAAGVSSRADLVRDFQPVADQIIEAVHQPSGDQGIVARLIASASSVITVRPVGSVEGDTPEAVVARIENKLQNGDLKGAQIEWQTLPEVARNAGAAFKTELDERIAVEDGVGAIVSGAMAQNGNQG